MEENVTPQGTIARLAVRPQYRPPLVTDEYDLPEGPTAIGLVRRGCYIAVDGRWYSVLGCTQKDDKVQVHTFLLMIEAHQETPCYLAEVKRNAHALPPGR